MKKKKRVLTLIIVCFAIALGIGVYFAIHYIDQSDSATSKKGIDFSSVSKETAKRLQKENDRSQTSFEQMNEESSEERIVEAMHKMSHQKVEANTKWGALQMNEANINEIANILANTKTSLPHKEQLERIIEKWKSGDFSSADKDHNYIWKLQDGNIGKATGVLSAEEEQEFIKANFDN
ncbi:DUF6241 domain-containing protein [Bacillus sp. 1P06AnD]|uniref:DUF6241 domain-containing protein n=1 Tax=Bacillus sp. 1P06AnD TaxID=3132208 RepID=UPI00399F686D